MGTKTSVFFGRANPWIGPAPILVTGNYNTGYQLEAGQAHGICKGYEFAVCAMSPLGLPSGTKCDIVALDVLKR